MFSIPSLSAFAYCQVKNTFLDRYIPLTDDRREIWEKLLIHVDGKYIPRLIPRDSFSNKVLSDEKEIVDYIKIVSTFSRTSPWLAYQFLFRCNLNLVDAIICCQICP
jgi:hypothetical protein